MDSAQIDSIHRAGFKIYETCDTGHRGKCPLSVLSWLILNCRQHDDTGKCCVV